MLEAKVEEVEYNEQHNNRSWKSCCFELDSRCVAYLGQFIFSMSLLTFCAYMLVKFDGACDKSSAYVNILSFMLGKILSSVISSNEK